MTIICPAFQVDQSPQFMTSLLGGSVGIDFRCSGKMLTCTLSDESDGLAIGVMMTVSDVALQNALSALAAEHVIAQESVLDPVKGVLVSRQARVLPGETRNPNQTQPNPTQTQKQKQKTQLRTQPKTREHIPGEILAGLSPRVARVSETRNPNPT